MNHEEEYEALFDRLESCRQQGAPPSSDEPELHDLLMISQALDQLGEEPVEMPRAYEFRQTLMRRVRRRPVLRSFSAGLVLAATILAGLLFLREPPGQPSREIVIQPEMINQVIEKQARTDMVDYLENTELLLVSIRDFDFKCSDDSLDMAMEKKLAQGLLMQQKMFHHSLTDPRYFQARELFDQLERILVDVNNLDPCSDQMEIEFLNKHINSKRILSKLRVIAQEIQYS
ncbi:hypothetical protein [Acanthopleuribacter pedis]|uniref:Uncharacterized protein n=1 Tax=Acanthopleuribacter pedis TaxID=442870 RepID=A0A8J7U200_9BACT|nr:hypothetical protein [Acanthopleuribacter pedis]MBO1317204.1 hypothetical protein [Acanthopleuribacter pedis]